MVGMRKSPPHRQEQSLAAIRPMNQQIRLSVRQVLAALLAVHLIAALLYCRGVPLGEGPDEDSHVLFIQTLAGQQPPGTTWRLGLPVLRTDCEDPNFEVHQPPLYYVLAQPFYRLGGAPDRKSVV